MASGARTLKGSMIRTGVSLMLIAMIAGCGVASTPPTLPSEMLEALKGSSSVTLYSIQSGGGLDLPEWDFHGHHQNGHVELKRPLASRAIAALTQAIAQGSAGRESLCLFSPRHALRVISKGSTFDILICYECGQLALYENNQPLRFSGSIGSGPQTLNRLLQQANIPLADDATALRDSYRHEAAVALQRAEQGDANAQEVIGNYLLSGRGIAKDEDQGIQWVARAGKTSVDDPVFEVKVGKLLDHSSDWPPDPIKAMTLFQAAAASGNAEGQYQVGNLYEVGEGVSVNQTEALQWFRKAADQGNPKAQYQLGVYFAKGWVVEQSYSDARIWFSRAAEQGHPEAMDWMGSIFYDGLGVTKDLAEAYFWFRLAREYHSFSVGPTPAVTAEQKAAAEKRIDDWKLSHATCPDDCHF